MENETAVICGFVRLKRLSEIKKSNELVGNCTIVTFYSIYDVAIYSPYEGYLDSLKTE